MIGATVARKTNLKVGDTFRPTHDVAGQDRDKHRPFTVVGVLEPTGTPNDRALFVNIEGFYRVGQHAGPGHAKPPAEAIRPIRSTQRPNLRPIRTPNPALSLKPTTTKTMTRITNMPSLRTT